MICKGLNFKAPPATLQVSKADNLNYANLTYSPT